MLIGNPKQLIAKLLDLDQDKEYEIKEYKKKRTIKQNDYYHELKNQFAKKMRLSPIEIHREMIFKSCPFDEYLVPEEASLRALEYYQEKKERINKNGKSFKIVKVYVGSSQLDTKEMTVLLDNMIEECKLQGIETMTPDELKRMRMLDKE